MGAALMGAFLNPGSVAILAQGLCFKQELTFGAGPSPGKAGLAGNRDLWCGTGPGWRGVAVGVSRVEGRGSVCP